MTGWIQSADFGVKDLAEMDLTAAMLTFTEHDWSGEKELEKDLLLRNEESCPPNFGLDHPHGHRLWICRTQHDACWVIFTRNSNRKLLGFIPLPNRELESTNVPHEMIDELIAEFYTDTSSLYEKIESIKYL